LARKPADMTVSREDILLAAAEVLQQRGYSGTTMKDIASVVQLTAASLYHHFRNKDTLILAVLEHGLSEGTRRVESLACSGQPATQRLNAMIRAHIIGLTERPAIGAAMVFEIHALAHVTPPRKTAKADELEAYTDFTARRNHFFALRDRFEELFRHVVREGIRSGEFRPQDAAITVKTLLGAQNWVGVWYRPDGRLSGEQIAERMAAMLMEGIVKEVMSNE